MQTALQPEAAAHAPFHTMLVDQWSSRADDLVVVESRTGPMVCDPLVVDLLEAIAPVGPDPAGGSRQCRRYLLDVDGKNHVVLVASLPRDPNRRAIALARYVRVGGSRVASPAIVVERAMRRRGIGTRLLDDLVSIARAQGIERFRIEIHDPEPAVLHFIRRAAPRPTVFWGATSSVNRVPPRRCRALTGGSRATIVAWYEERCRDATVGLDWIDRVLVLAPLTGGRGSRRAVIARQFPRRSAMLR